MAVPADRQAARELVEQISDDNGYFTEEELREINPGTRRKIERFRTRAHEDLGLSVITLANNLYTNKARCIFELLQNADDNDYRTAAESGSLPSVSFHVYSRKVVIECNEDGFTGDNLKAICSIGKSSKKGAQGYIGEKGIGFKSVFMVAWKVHIQSGPFSFSFTHRPGDSGIGMVTPIWEGNQEELVQPLTRLTLYLHNPGDGSTLAKTRDTIHQQFKELHGTFLLFMNSLRKIHVNFYDYDDDQRLQSSTTYSMEYPPRPNYVVLRTVTNSEYEKIQYFHLTTYEATSLAEPRDRTCLEAEISGSFPKSRIVLAFPLSETDVPIIEPQDIFAFLPVRPVGFNFLIHADFQTDASRQDIVKDSPRNEGLLIGVADAFAKAVLQLCEHESLRYKWMRYLPDTADKNFDMFWHTLVKTISAYMVTLPVLYCHKKNDPHHFKDLVRLSGDLYHEGQPLFDDGDTEKIISQLYAPADLDILRGYGLKYASWAEVNEWVRQDLGREESRIKSNETAESWHTQVAKLLRRAFDKLPCQLRKVREKVKEVYLLPIQDGEWVSTATGPVYFSRVDGIDIPQDLNLRIIAKSVTGDDRLRLFKDLGTEEASVALVRKQILEKYSVQDDEAFVPLEASKAHLEFLYLTHHLKGEDEPSYEGLWIYGLQESVVYRPHFYIAYFADDSDAYGPFELLRETGPGLCPGDGARGFDAAFIAREYFDSIPVQPTDQELTWVEWLCEEIMVESYVGFTFDNSTTWDGAAEYLRTERPEKFLGALLIHHQHNPEPTDDFIQCVQNTNVLCRGNRRVSLREAYFPTQILDKLVGQYVEPNAFFPWLWLDAKDTEDYVPSDWKEMLTAYGVGLAEAVDFALHMLQYSLDSLQVPADGDISPSSRTRLFALYDHIQSTYRAAEDRNAARDKIRAMFKDKNCIYIPPTEDRCSWTSLDNCVWNAPQIMKTRSVLRLLYESCCSLAEQDLIYLQTFFTETIGLGKCTWELYVDELRMLRRTGCKNIDTITVIYQELQTLASEVNTDVEKEKFRNSFEDDALIFVPSGGGPSWHKASKCVWSTVASLRGRVSLNPKYEVFENFFLRFIGVKPVDLRMAIDELKKVGSHSEPVPIKDVKDTVMTVNSLLANEEKPPQPGKILEYRIFPIRQPSGDIECGAGVDEFFIVDREPLRRSFEGSVKFLDFTLDEVVELGPFITWTSVETRYISSCVKEWTTSSGSGERALSHPNREIRHKAHALLRIAFHFNSPRTTSLQGRMALYEILRNAQVYETDGLTSELCLVQDGYPHVVEGETTGLHFHEDDTKLTIYVSADEDDQDYTFAKALPERLFEWLMTHPDSNITAEKSERGVAAARAVLLAPVSRVTRALEDCGIKTIQDVDDVDEAAGQEPTSPVSDTPVTRASDDGTGTSISGNDQSGADLASGDRVTPASSIETTQQPSAWESGMNSHSGSPSPLRSSRDLLKPPGQSTYPIRSAHDPMYVALLSRIMAAGKSLGYSISKFEGTIMDNQHLIDNGVNHEVHSASPHERNLKIGAAGELYIFELLSHLDLPGFSEDNWQSQVRKYVSVHPEYAGLKPWTKQETSDITYRDTSGRFTEFLIKGNYLDRETWSEKTPKYFIEVKTTVLSRDEPFYMSTAQYSRMKKNVLAPSNTDTIYVIFRVFNLGRGPLGLKLYLDPETLRSAGKLKFSANTWSVVPSRI